MSVWSRIPRTHPRHWLRRRRSVAERDGFVFGDNTPTRRALAKARFTEEGMARGAPLRCGVRPDLVMSSAPRPDFT